MAERNRKQNKPATPGRFVTFEGIDGAGKSTHVAACAEWLEARGIETVITREPGGTPLGETLRGMLLHQKMVPETEALLMFAARSEHVHTLIRPALSRGAWVISDRFADASYAYQGGGRGIPFDRLSLLETFTHGGFLPDVTFLFYLDPEVAKTRLAKTGQSPDKFESEKNAFFERVQDAYMKRAASDPKRFVAIDASKPVSDIRAEVLAVLEKLSSADKETA